jgi:hypothetical protein
MVLLDFLTQIVNVHWGGGGIYVTGSQWAGLNPSSDVWTNTIASIEDGLTHWVKTISTPHSGGFTPSAYPGSSVGALVGATDKTPMFVLGGLTDNFETGGPFPALMMTSTDGVSWEQQTLVSSGEVYLLTWNDEERFFYAGMQDYTRTFDPDASGTVADIFDVVLRSTDGVHWTEIERVSREDLDIFSSPIEKYCSNKILDIHDHKVPTSVFGYNKTSDILIAPDPINMSWGVSYPSGEDYHHGDKFKIIRGPGNDHPGSAIRALPAGMERVWAVAYAAGIWQAGGMAGEPAHGVVATSVDNGDTWTITLTAVAGSYFTNMAAVDQSSTSES